MKLSWNCGAVKVGSPNQAASDTPSRLTRKWVVTSPAPVGAVISPTTTSSTQDSRKPKISARKIAIRDQKPRKATAATIVKIITVSATPGSCGQYTPATTAGQVEPDQHHHRAADHGRQHGPHRPAAHQMDEHADRGQGE